MKDKLLQIINHYGLENQLKYIHSEYYELDEAINRYDNPDDLRFSKVNIAEEIADVMVMLKQFQYFYNIKDEAIEEIMNRKIDRQIERMKSE